MVIHMKRTIICKNTGKPLQAIKRPDPNIQRTVPAITYYNEELGVWGNPIPVTRGEIMNNTPGRPQMNQPQNQQFIQQQTPMQQSTPYPQQFMQQAPIQQGTPYPQQFSFNRDQPPFIPLQQAPQFSAGGMFQNQPAPDTTGITGDFVEEPDTLTNPIYLPAMLESYIGYIVRIEFLIGDTLIDRIGRLSAVGASYLTLSFLDSDIILICDIYSVKFVLILLRESEG